MDDRIGQLIWAFIGSQHDLELAEPAARQGRIGGIWLLPDQVRTAEETVGLVNRFQAISPLPLLVGVDAEAGMGQVMGTATHLPAAMALGATGHVSLAREAAAVTAREASVCGINVVAAPVLDVNVASRNPIINTRAYGGCADLVTRFGLAFLEGLQGAAETGARVLPIGKHFPGHGDTVHDSHLRLDAVEQPLRRLKEVEFPPFKAAIAANIPMLMTAHVAYPALDPEPGTPATLSFPILSELLRKEFGFQGAVVTDCMNMHAICRNFDPREAALRAVVSGCDLLLTDRWNEAHETLTRSLGTGRFSHVRVQEACTRVRSPKAEIFGPELARPQPLDLRVAQSVVGCAEHLEVAERIARASITLIDGDLSHLVGRPLVMATRMKRRSGPTIEAQVRAALTSSDWQDADILMLDPVPQDSQLKEAVARASTAGWAALLHFNQVRSFDPTAVLANGELVSLTRQIADRGVPVVVFSLGSPYVLVQFDAAIARLCSYSTCDASLRAGLNVLRGRASPRGRLPVPMDEVGGSPHVDAASG